MPLLFFFNDTATPEIYTLSLHDALPISPRWVVARGPRGRARRRLGTDRGGARARGRRPSARARRRSEEHTSELQSHVNLVCRLLLEKKKSTHAYCFTGFPLGTASRSL